MNVLQDWGPYTAQVVENTSLDTVRLSYRELLETDGIAFPDNELAGTIQLWDAWAAQQRGADYLDDEGRPVDLAGFDADTARKAIVAGGPLIANAQKLEIIANLGLLSKAGSLAAANAEGRNGTSSPKARAYAEMRDVYKHLVQVALATEEWERPWREIVEYGFEGSNLRLPLDVSGVGYGVALINLKPYAEIRSRYFKVLPVYRFAVGRAIEDDPQCHSIEPYMPQLVSQAGVFYRHSAEGCEEIIHHWTANGSLKKGIDWHAVVKRAVASASYLLEGRKNTT